MSTKLALCDTIMSIMDTHKVYIVRAAALTGRVWLHEFKDEAAALTQIRKYKDKGGYITTLSTIEKELV